MKDKTIDLFVPGRLCIIGEHSDWAGKYRNINNKINKGYAIVTGIEQGIYAKVKKSDKLIVKNKVNHKSFKSNMNYDNLKKIAEQGEYWSYIVGVTAYMINNYNVGGIEVIINNSTLKEKKGLSSSAAICVLIARAFNELYKLNLTTKDEMNIAYQGEILTLSRCGRLDQACAFGKVPVLMTFDGDNINVERIKVKEPLYFVFADLMKGKDTVKILGDLNRSYPFAQSEMDEQIHKALGIENDKYVHDCIKYIKEGNIEKVGTIMNKYQANFDKKIAPASPDELLSPVLHKVLNDEYIISLSYGRKGVGSHGDGSVQVLAKDYNTQQELLKYFKKKLHMDAYTLTIDANNPIRKAIIPVAGNGTRMFPITKCVKKSFLPIVDKDGIIKPVILSLLEELVDAGIEEICLIIDEEDRKEYDKLFDNISNDISSKLSRELIEYQNKIESIGKKITYVYQKDKLGLGHAVSLCDKFANHEPVLLVLGDQLYKSNTNKSCTEQFLSYYNNNNKLSISVCEIDEKDVSRYGILSGVIEGNNNYFNVDKITEKPDISVAREKCYTKVKNTKKYYAVFGEYIINDEVFKLLKNNIKNKIKENGEYQLTSVLEEVRSKSGMTAFIPDGKMLDVGNVDAYKNTFIEKIK